MPGGCTLLFEPFVATQEHADRFENVVAGNIYGQSTEAVDVGDGVCKRLLARPTVGPTGDIVAMSCNCPDGSVITAEPIAATEEMAEREGSVVAGNVVWQEIPTGMTCEQLAGFEFPPWIAFHYPCKIGITGYDQSANNGLYVLKREIKRELGFGLAAGCLNLPNFKLGAESIVQPSWPTHAPFFSCREFSSFAIDERPPRESTRVLVIEYIGFNAGLRIFIITTLGIIESIYLEAAPRFGNLYPRNAGITLGRTIFNPTTGLCRYDPLLPVDEWHDNNRHGYAHTRWRRKYSREDDNLEEIIDSSRRIKIENVVLSDIYGSDGVLLEPLFSPLTFLGTGEMTITGQSTEPANWNTTAYRRSGWQAFPNRPFGGCLEGVPDTCISVEHRWRVFEWFNMDGCTGVRDECGGTIMPEVVCR